MTRQLELPTFFLCNIPKEENLYTDNDIGKDLSCIGSDIKEEQIINRLHDKNFRALIRILNLKQRNF